MGARRLARLGAVACLAAALAALAAAAQTTSASLLGTVRTEGGAAVSGAVVQARSTDTGIVRTTVTDDKGDYRLDSLAPGEWTVVARLDGRTSESRTVELTHGG